MLNTALLLTLLGIVVAKLDPELEIKYKTLTKNEFIEYFNSKNYSFTITDNDHLGIFPMGVLPGSNGSNLPVVNYDDSFISDLPENFDSRTKWPNCPSIGEIYNQKACGSCWAFGTATVASDRTCIHANLNVRLAEEDFECQQKSVCDGGSPSQAFEFWRDQGLVTQECKPYDIEELKRKLCIKKCVNGRSYEADKHFAEKVYQVVGVDAIKTELVSKGPVEAGIVVYADFFMYKHGVYEHKFGHLEGYHSVRIIGYGVENDVEYWLVANSYGTGWGQKGFIKMKIGDPCVKIESCIHTGLPKK